MEEGVIALPPLAPCDETNQPLQALIPPHEIVDRVLGEKVVETRFGNQATGGIGWATEHDGVPLLCQFTCNRQGPPRSLVGRVVKRNVVMSNQSPIRSKR